MTLSTSGGAAGTGFSWSLNQATNACGGAHIEKRSARATVFPEPAQLTVSRIEPILILSLIS